MKVRRFYPHQVLLRLRGRHVDALSRGELCALEFFIKRSRRYQLQVTILDEERIVQVTDIRYVMKINPLGGLNIVTEPVKVMKSRRAVTMSRTVEAERPLTIDLDRLGYSPEQVAILDNTMNVAFELFTKQGGTFQP